MEPSMREVPHVVCDASSKPIKSFKYCAGDEIGEPLHLRLVNNKDIADSLEVKCVPRLGNNNGHYWYNCKIKPEINYNVPTATINICILEIKITFNSTSRTFKWTGNKYISKKPDEGTGTKREWNFADGERTLYPVYEPI